MAQRVEGASLVTMQLGHETVQALVGTCPKDQSKADRAECDALSLR